jgi:hypothetical protein
MEQIHRIHVVGKVLMQACEICGRVVRVCEVKQGFVCEYCKRKETLAEIVKGAECR